MVFDNNYSTKADNENTTISKEDTEGLKKYISQNEIFF